MGLPVRRALGLLAVLGVAERERFLIPEVADKGGSLAGPHGGARRRDPRGVVAVQPGNLPSSAALAAGARLAGGG